MTAAKFEPGTQLSAGQMISVGPSSLTAAPSSATGVIPMTANPYCWGPEWELAAAAAMGRSAVESQLVLANPYGQMAAAMSAASAASNGGPMAAVYPQAAASYGYYGLAAQRAAAGSAALNGYLGAGGPYSGYASSADYYGTMAASFPGYYAALSSASVDPKAFAQYSQYMTGVGVGGHPSLPPPVELTSAAELLPTGSELDSPPVGAACSSGLSPSAAGTQFAPQNQQQQQKGREKSNCRTDRTTTASKRSKKKKNAVRGSPAEPNNTRVFVWELEDLCSVLPAKNHYRPGVDQLLSDALSRLFQFGFQLEQPDEYEQANVEDAQMDEALQQAAASGAAQQLMEEGGSTAESQPPAAGEQVTGRGGQQQNGPNESLRRLAAKYRLIRDTYERHKGPALGELLERCGIRAKEFLSSLDQYERMVSTPVASIYRQCLRLVAQSSTLMPSRCANVVLSSSSLDAGVAGALGRLMLCGMADHVSAENVFCTTKTSKEASMERLFNQFQKRYMVIITSSQETQELARREHIPCWFFYGDSDLAKLPYALDIILRPEHPITFGLQPTAASMLMAPEQHQQFSSAAEQANSSRLEPGGHQQQQQRSPRTAADFLSMRG